MGRGVALSGGEESCVIPIAGAPGSEGGRGLGERLEVALTRRGPAPLGPGAQSIPLRAPGLDCQSPAARVERRQPGDDVSVGSPAQVCC